MQEASRQKGHRYKRVSSSSNKCVQRYASWFIMNGWEREVRGRVVKGSRAFHWTLHVTFWEDSQVEMFFSTEKSVAQEGSVGLE